MPISYQQFGGGTGPSTPLSLGAQTSGTVAQRTAWRVERGGDTPEPYTSKTAGSVRKWDDDNSGPSIPKADKGVGRSDG